MSDGSLLILGISGPELTPAEAERFTRLQPAGFVLFPRNIVSAAQTRKLTDDLRALSKLPPIIAIGHGPHGGSSGNPVIPPVPSPRMLAGVGNIRSIGQTATRFADILRLLGVNMNLAPVLDLDWYPGHAIGDRRWGRDPQRVIDHAGVWNRFARKRGVAGCAGYFPAFGRAVAPSNNDFPSCAATWEDLQREDVIPYTALMPELDAIMTAHARFPRIDPDFPASLSVVIVRRLLRDRLGFDRHLVLTDDLDAGGIPECFGRGEDVRLAIEAGNDLAVIGQRPETADDAARALRLVPAMIRADAVERVERFRWKVLQAPLPWSDSKWLAAREDLAAVCLPPGGPGEV